MKTTKQFLSVMLFLFVFILSARAYAYTGQYSWDPIYISPTQETKNSQLEQSLKSRYGISAFYGCYSCTYTDTSDPNVQARCLNAAQYCLERQAIAKETQCSSGYVYLNGRCITIDNGCKEQYGIGSYYRGVKDENGKYSCDCSTGFEWNSAGTACEKVESAATPACSIGNFPIKQIPGKCGTPIEYCDMSYGNGIYYTGILDNNGDPKCDCINGYKWNSSYTGCEKNADYSDDTAAIPEGAMIKTADNPDVYIVKYSGNKKFKRLILSPSVFKSYGHLKWENIITVNQEALDSFTASDLVRAAGDNNIYRLYPQGDSGQKRLVRDNSVLTRLGLDPDSIYEINSFDRESYVKGLDL